MKKQAKIINALTKTDTFLNNSRNLLLSAKETAGDVYLVEGIMPKGSEVPAHMHTKEDEIFHVLEGEVELILGDETMQATKGAIIYLPRNVKHGIKTIGNKTARVLNYVIPGKNFEDFFNELHASQTEISPEIRAKIAERYGITFYD